jgi:hypothetical protein
MGLGTPETVIVDAELVSPTDVTVPLPPPPGGVAQVPSARRKLAVPPPDAGTIPGNIEVKTLGVIVIVPAPVTGLLPIVKEEP